VMVDQMRRTGLLVDATSLCASGLGACHTEGGLDGATDEVRVHCASCPLIPLAPHDRAPAGAGASAGSRFWFGRR